MQGLPFAGQGKDGMGRIRGVWFAAPMAAAAMARAQATHALGQNGARGTQAHGQLLATTSTRQLPARQSAPAPRALRSQAPGARATSWSVARVLLAGVH